MKINKNLLCRYEFQGDLLEVISSDSDTKPYTRMCIQEYDNYIFLVAHEERGQTSGKYTCMQIVMRGKSVLQIRQAKVSPTLKAGLCFDNNLDLDGWLIIDTNSVMNQREHCSLNGGFNMQVYDKSSFTGVCDGYLGETRMESECLPGEGLNFYFRQATCVPDGLYMGISQRTYCLANWDDEVFNFILLKHDRLDHLWVFRYPMGIRRGNNFKALLMKDLYSSTETAVSESNNHLILSISNQTPKSLNTLCYDDYEICSDLEDPCAHSEDVARACARTCGYCSDTRHAVCHFNLSINGSWTDANHPEDGPQVQINATSVDITGTETLHCIDWSDGERSSAKRDPDLRQIDSDHTDERMLVTISDNGCRPRFTCAKITKLPRVLFMQLSQTRLWPLVSGRGDRYNCSNFVYTTNKDVDKNPYRKRLSTLFTTTRVTSVSCDLSRFSRFDVRFKGGTFCTGSVAQSSSKNTVQFHLSNCPASILTRTKFTCVEYANLSPQGDMLLVTRTNTTTPNVHCWLFPEKPNNVFHMVASEDCNGAMKRKIRKGRLHPIATFTRNESLMVMESTKSQGGLLSTSTEEIQSTSETFTNSILDFTSTPSTIKMTELASTTKDTNTRMQTTKSVINKTNSVITTTNSPPRSTKEHKLLESITTSKLPMTTAESSTYHTEANKLTEIIDQHITKQSVDTNTDNEIIDTSTGIELTTDTKLDDLYTEFSLDNTTYLKGNSSVGTWNDYDHPSPAVAAAIVLTFIAFQVSIICKCSC